MTEPNQPPGIDAPQRPWRLIVLIGWVVFVLAYDRHIPGVRLNFAGNLLAVVILMTASWFAMPKRRAELMAFATLIAIGAIGVAAGLTMPQKLALIGLVALLPLAERALASSECEFARSAYPCRGRCRHCRTRVSYGGV